MSNPFITRFDSRCGSCGDIVYEGDEMFAVDGEFICRDCADINDNICECGQFKREEFETCFDCKDL